MKKYESRKVIKEKGATKMNKQQLLLNKLLDYHSITECDGNDCELDEIVELALRALPEKGCVSHGQEKSQKA